MVHKMGERIQKYRKGQGMSQEEFGAVLNVSRQTISKWENNDSLPDVYNLIAIARLFHISIDELVLGISSTYRSTNLMQEIRAKRKKRLLYGRICLLAASFILAPTLIIMDALAVEQPTLGIVAAVVLIIFGFLGFLAIHNFVKAMHLKEELSYLDSIKTQPSTND